MRLLKKSAFITFAAVAAFGIFQAVATNDAEAADKPIIRLGSASPGSSGYVQFEALSYLVNQYSDKYKASSVATAGSAENMELLKEKKIDFGSGDSLSVVTAWEQKNIPIWQVASWTYWSVPMVVRKDSGINTIADLKGKPVSLIKKGSGTEFAWGILFDEYGILGDIKKQFLSWGDSYDALADGLLSAAPGNFAAGKPNPAMERLGSRVDYKVLEIDPAIMKSAQKRNPGFLATTLPKTAYKGLEKDYTTIGWSGIILSTPSVDDEMVYELCKAMYEHVDELHQLSAVGGATTKGNAVKWLNPDYPVHPGAARFYKEIGVWDDSLKIGSR
jgi:TRAP transporter TAXI family solute receptor